MADEEILGQEIAAIIRQHVATATTSDRARITELERCAKNRSGCAWVAAISKA